MLLMLTRSLNLQPKKKMSAKDLQISLCHDSGCGLLVAETGDSQVRASLLPDEVLEARELAVQDSGKLREFLVDIDEDFAAGIDAVGIDRIATELREHRLPKILRQMAEE